MVGIENVKKGDAAMLNDPCCVTKKKMPLKKHLGRDICHPFVATQAKRLPLPCQPSEEVRTHFQRMSIECWLV